MATTYEDCDDETRAMLDGLIGEYRGDLAAAGLLLDDTQSRCELGPVAFRRGRAFETTIILEDLDR